MSDKVLASGKGINGTATLHEDKIVISREGFSQKMSGGFFSGTKELMIKDISGIQFREATAFSNGFIEFTIPGEGSSRSSNSFTQSDRMKNENCVVWRKEMMGNQKNENFSELKKIAQELINKNPKGGTAVNVVQETSSADELAKFADLKEKGIISEEEFEAKKKELLGL
tara:strand:+ start:131 stop:640 length:510 start_codon:yes stop_codon:yes gene_type:complete